MTYDILLVEDDSQIREVIEDFFAVKSEGHIKIHSAANGSDGLAAAYEKEFDLCMLDIMLPGAMDLKSAVQSAKKVLFRLFL